MKHVVKKQRARESYLLSIPRRIAQQLDGIDFFRVDFDNGRIIFSPLLDAKNDSKEVP